MGDRAAQHLLVVLDAAVALPFAQTVVGTDLLGGINAGAIFERFALAATPKELANHFHLKWKGLQ